MKKVILQEKPNEVFLSDLKTGDILGMKTSLGNKFFLSKTTFGSYEWIGANNICSDLKVSHNYFKESFKDCQNVFVFETYKDLFKWLSE